MLLTHDEYKEYSFAAEITQDRFDETLEYAAIHVRDMISRLIGHWRVMPLEHYGGVRLKCVKKALALQIKYIIENGGTDVKPVTSIKLHDYREYYAVNPKAGEARFCPESMAVLREGFGTDMWV